MDWSEFGIAISLVLIIEGLFLFVAPVKWKQMVESMLVYQPNKIRTFGFVVLLIGMIILTILKS